MQIRAYKTNQSIIRQVNGRSYREEMLNEIGENTPITALMQNKINAEINAYCSTCFYFYFTGDFNKQKTLKSQESINLTSNIKQNKCKIKFKNGSCDSYFVLFYFRCADVHTHTHTRLTALCAGLPG